jgi:hypothetical protein
VAHALKYVEDITRESARQLAIEIDEVFAKRQPSGRPAPARRD